MNILDISIQEREDLNSIQLNIMIKDPGVSIQCNYISIECAERLIKDLSCVLKDIKSRKEFVEILDELGPIEQKSNFYERDKSDFDEVEEARINYYNKLLMNYRGNKK